MPKINMMKTVILSIVFVLSLNLVSAQYKSYKDNYNVKTYSYAQTDRYNPGTAGVLAVLPGAGHCYDGESGRGLKFIGGIVGSWGIGIIGFSTAWGGDEVLGSALMIAGCGSALFFYVWSIIDAVEVAKIKNMHLNVNPVSFKIEPQFEGRTTNNLNSDIIGVSLKMNF